MATATLNVKGMSCGHCVKAVADALQELDGVSRADVDLDAGRAVVDYDDERTDTKQMVGAVFDEGYTAEEAV